MRAVVTGITGFVGSHLAEHLRAAGDECLGIVRASPGVADARAPRGELPAAVRAARLVPWDLSSADVDEELLRRLDDFAPEVVFHLAALSIPADCGTDAPTPAAAATNVDGTARVLRLARSLRRRPRVVFASSSHVYGAVSPQAPVVDEDTPCAPRSAYGRTKLAAEQVVSEAAAGDGSDVVIVRSFIQAGSRQDSRLMLPQWAAQFVRGGLGPIDVVSLDVAIDLLDVRDAVRALRLVALHGRSGGTYNLGSGVARTTGEVFDRLRRAADSTREARPLRPGARCEPIADVRRLQAATGWRPEIPLERTVADVLDDWRARLSRDVPPS